MMITKFRPSILATLAAVIPYACLAQNAAIYTATNKTTYSFADISQTGASVLSGTDDGTAPLTIPFVFQFYGQPYTLVCASTNGALYFISSGASCNGIVDFVNTDLTMTSTPSGLPAVLPFWMDLTFQVPGGGAVYYQATGTGGSRKFIVQWNNAYPQGSPNPVTFQVILSEGSNAILFQYRTTTLGPANPATNGGRATIGIAPGGPVNAPAQLTGGKDNSTPRRPIQYSVGARVVPDQTAVLYSVPPSTTCASNVSSQVNVKRGGFTYSSSTQTFLQTVTVTNSGTTSIEQPLYLVLDGLSSNANLANASGTTNCTSMGNPYLAIPTSNSLAPGQSISVQLQFVDPTKGSIIYTTQVLSGSGTP